VRTRPPSRRAGAPDRAPARTACGPLSPDGCRGVPDGLGASPAVAVRSAAPSLPGGPLGSAPPSRLPAPRPSPPPARAFPPAVPRPDLPRRPADRPAPQSPGHAYRSAGRPAVRPPLAKAPRRPLCPILVYTRSPLALRRAASPSPRRRFPAPATSRQRSGASQTLYRPCPRQGRAACRGAAPLPPSAGPPGRGRAMVLSPAAAACPSAGAGACRLPRGRSFSQRIAVLARPGLPRPPVFVRTRGTSRRDARHNHAKQDPAPIFRRKIARKRKGPVACALDLPQARAYHSDGRRRGSRRWGRARTWTR
jgi:hypothetical protein